ncbi:MAG: glycosyltransferase family 4 protein [Desulfobacterales bacterium]|nr:glycosyltransferase family 4 protein [Desulfobacterales bacterium]
MSIYGSVINYHDDSHQIIYGMRVASRGFLHALLRYGEFDEYHFFLNDQKLHEFCDTYQTFLDTLDHPVKMKAFRIRELPGCLSRLEYDVFHASDPYIANLCYLRRCYSNILFPVTGVTHSLSMEPAMDNFQNIMVSPHLPCDSIICTSQSGKKAMEHIFSQVMLRANAGDTKGGNFSYWGRLDVIPLGVEPQDFLTIDKKSARDALNLPINRRLIVCPGRISVLTKMDLYPVLLALKEIITQEEFKDTALLIAGSTHADNTYLHAIVSQARNMGISDHLFFNFNFSSEQKYQIYAAADIVLSAADNVQETFGIVPVEAMMAQRPVVLSYWSGYRDLVEDGVSGYLIPTYWAECDNSISPIAFYQTSEALFSISQSVAVDVGVMIDRLKRLLASQELRHSMGEHARSRALSLFSWSHVIRQYRELWRELKLHAETIPWNRSSVSHGFLGYFNVFGHYASHIISETDFVVITERGKMVAEAIEDPFVYKMHDGKLDTYLVFQLLADAQCTQQVGVLMKKTATTQDKFMVTLLWLIKNNLLAVNPH